MEGEALTDNARVNAVFLLHVPSRSRNKILSKDLEIVPDLASGGVGNDNLAFVPLSSGKRYFFLDRVK